MFGIQNSSQQIKQRPVWKRTVTGARPLSTPSFAGRGISSTQQGAQNAGSPAPGRPVFAKSAGSSSTSQELYDPYNHMHKAIKSPWGGSYGGIIPPKFVEQFKFLAEHRDERQNAMQRLTDQGFTRPTRQTSGTFGSKHIIGSFEYPADVWKGPDGRLVHVNPDGSLSPWDGRR